MNLLTGPAGAGKTERLLGRAHEAMGGGKRVWWVGLPSQRAYVYRRATQAGALLGLEFLSSQQVYYRLLARALRLKPLVVGTGRVALVGEALLELRGELPAPGEARLFTRAIAEAKRYGLSHGDIQSKDEETKRFREVFGAYEAVKGERWDYDDFRTEALRLAGRGEARPEADLVVVDGFREVGPLELDLYKALGQTTELWLSLPEAPPGEAATETLPPRRATILATHRAPNPVSEARWVLRSLKRDLAAGFDPLELAVILPEREARAFLTLADEYGVPTMDETPKALADTLPGRLLLDLLELPDHPTASKLLALPELAPLAKAALDRGVTGLQAITALAEELGLAERLRRWLAVLEVPGERTGDELAWAEELLNTSLADLRRDDGGPLDWGRFRDHALQRAKEASRIARGASFRAWWAALLHETFVFDRPRGGVAVLSATLASGRRFGRAYLMRAVEGAYSVGEREDYFVPEDDRGSLEVVFARYGLPKRFGGRDRGLFAELLTRADALTVTYPEADQGGPLVPQRELVGAGPISLPEVAAASPLELPGAPYRAPSEPLNLGTVSLQNLMRYDRCAFQYWAESRLKEEGEAPWWLLLLNEMRDYTRLTTARLGSLKTTYPDAAAWLDTYETELSRLLFGVTLPETPLESGPHARLDATLRRGSEVVFYRFAPPGTVSDAARRPGLLEKTLERALGGGLYPGALPGPRLGRTPLRLACRGRAHRRFRRPYHLPLAPHQEQPTQSRTRLPPLRRGRSFALARLHLPRVPRVGRVPGGAKMRGKRREERGKKRLAPSLFSHFNLFSGEVP